MCTVTYVYNDAKIIITSNRDEHRQRPKSIVPKTYLIQDKKIFFPKDPRAGGTWYAIDETGNVIVLLNGAKKKHVPKASYARSRGLIVLDIISSPNGLNTWNDIDLSEVEPFTLVFYTKHQLYQLQWDGIQKELKALNRKANHIWSSSTLYEKEIREQREQWFDTFSKTKAILNANDMLHFHQYTEAEDLENGLVINRNEKLITQSITQTEIDQNKLSFTHFDLLDNQQYKNTFLLL